MRKILLAMALFPLIAVTQLATAQNTLNGQDMNKLMEQAQKAQACMKDIDQAEMQEIKRGSDEMETKIRGLCDAGKRDEAQQQALDFSRNLMKSDTMAKIKECSEYLRGMLPEMPFDNFEEKMASKNVCDELK